MTKSAFFQSTYSRHLDARRLSERRIRHRAIFLSVTSAILLTVATAIGKYLLYDYHLLEVTWAKNISFLVPMLLIGYRGVWTKSIRRPPSLLQIGQAFLPLLGGMLSLLALRYLSLVEVTAISFTAPIIITALAALLLGEHPTLSHWLAVIGGFIGVAIILRPGGAMQVAALLPLATALCIALSAISARMLGRTVNPFITLFYTGLIGTITMTPLLPFVWHTPSLEASALMIAMGLVYGLSQYFGFQALSMAAATTLAPFVYVRLIAAGVLGAVLFGEYPDILAILGAATIIASGLYTALNPDLSRRLKS